MDKCGLCGKILEEGGMDHHGLDHPYEMPYKLAWDDETHCRVGNKIVWNICGICLRRVMKAVNQCIDSREN